MNRSTISNDSAAFVRDLLLRRAGISIDTSKNYLIESRLLPLLRDWGIETLDDAVAQVRRAETSPIARAMVDALTTNETYFFRDGHPFELLRERLIPVAMKARASSQTLRVWSAASSTGQEAYSIAMVIRDHFPELATWDVKILATDINAGVVERAREGVYRGFEVNRGLPTRLLRKYFVEEGGDFRANRDLRSLVDFRVLNLLDPWPLKEWVDIVFMRNVLIYFEPLMKCRILARVREHLHTDGSLVLGGGEAAVHNTIDFETVHAGPMMYYRARPRGRLHAA